MVAKMMNTCLQMILVERNPQGAVQFVKQTISDLLCNRIDISQLVITKELTKSDKEYANKQVHLLPSSPSSPHLLRRTASSPTR